MLRTRVKMCGINSLKDALMAVDSGADALGFVFYQPSPRYVTPEMANDIMSHLPPFVSTVALFVNESTMLVNEIIQQTAIDCLQFHGDESPSYCMSFDRPYYKAIRIREETDVVAVEQDYHHAQAILLDTYVKGKPGGTGKMFNWDKIPADITKPIILAGGLTSDNISTAISTVKPYAVDVSGGIEDKPGSKSAEKIKQFMLNVNKQIELT